MSSISDVQAVNWILTAAAVVLTGGRLAIRLSRNHRIYADDCAHLLALTLLIIHGATNQVTLAAKAQQKADLAPNSDVSTESLVQQYKHLHDLNTVNNVFLYAIMWIVKVAFLLLYRQIFSCHKTFNRVWWAVLIFVVLSYIPPFAAVLHTCTGAPSLADYEQCNSGSSFRTAKLIFTCVLNVVSDVMVMALPVWMLSELQMKLRQKIGLAAIFCVAIFCVALDVLRTAEAVGQHQNLYTVIEVNFTVIVSCLPTYRRLLGPKNVLQLWKSRSSSGDGDADTTPTHSTGTRRKSSADPEATVTEMTELTLEEFLNQKPRFSTEMNETGSTSNLESRNGSRNTAGRRST